MCIISLTKSLRIYYNRIEWPTENEFPPADDPARHSHQKGLSERQAKEEKAIPGPGICDYLLKLTRRQITQGKIQVLHCTRAAGRRDLEHPSSHLGWTRVVTLVSVLPADNELWPDPNIWETKEFNGGILFNSRHPGPRRVWKGGPSCRS